MLAIDENMIKRVDNGDIIVRGVLECIRQVF